MAYDIKTTRSIFLHNIFQQLDTVLFEDSAKCVSSATLMLMLFAKYLLMYYFL